MFNEAQFRRIRSKMIQNPKSVLEAARNGSPAEMMVFANSWLEPPARIPYIDALDVFLVHLQEYRVPDSMAEKFSDRANLAFTSMVGISKMGEILPETGPAIDRLIKAWPGIYKWSVYTFSARIEGLDRTESRRRAALDVLSSFWYCLCYRDLIRAQMVKTTATVEIVTRLWLEENDGPLPSKINLPAGSCLLASILREGQPEQLDRVLKFAGGNATEIAKLAIARLQRVLKGPDYQPNLLRIHFEVINAFSYSRDHPLRHALLGANAIWVVTGALLKLSVLVNTSSDPELLDVMVSAFGYLVNVIPTTNGFTWVNQAIGAGFLQAFCDCSTRFAELDPVDCDMILGLMGQILPPFLVFRSVIESVGSALAKIERGPQKERVERSKARQTWIKFVQLAQERGRIVKKAEESKGTGMTCDNSKCQKVGTKNSVRRCSACLSTFYCSKECQETAWKEGDHKTMCKLKQRARLEGRADNLTKRDYQFLHYFAMFDARMHIAELRQLAKRDHPETPLNEIVVHIDQSVVPPTYGVKELSTYAYKLEENFDVMSLSANEIARNEALIEKVQNDPEHYTIIDMIIPGGDADRKLMTLATGSFWKLDAREQRASEQASSPDALKRQTSFEKALRWVFQAAEEFEQGELRRKMRKLKT